MTQKEIRLDCVEAVNNGTVDILSVGGKDFSLYPCRDGDSYCFRAYFNGSSMPKELKDALEHKTFPNIAAFLKEYNKARALGEAINNKLDQIKRTMLLEEGYIVA